MSNVVKRGELYPVADGERLPEQFDPRLTRARWTGVVRCPHEGDWFLSGAVVEAYRATADLSQGYHIAELVQGRIVWPS